MEKRKRIIIAAPGAGRTALVEATRKAIDESDERGIVIVAQGDDPVLPIRQLPIKPMDPPLIHSEILTGKERRRRNRKAMRKQRQDEVKRYWRKRMSDN